MDGPPTSMMYSPPTGGAARRPSATIDRQQTSNRRFIISGEDDYLCAARNCASGRARSPRVPSVRGRTGGQSLPICIHFSAYEVIPRLPFSDQRESIAANQHFGWERPRIVIRRHYKSI